jgi:hypothetical protein
MSRSFWSLAVALVLLPGCGLNPGVDLPSAASKAPGQDAGALFAGGGGQPGSINTGRAGASGTGGSAGLPGAAGSPVQLSDAGVSDAGAPAADAVGLPGDSGARADH